MGWNTGRAARGDSSPAGTEAGLRTLRAAAFHFGTAWHGGWRAHAVGGAGLRGVHAGDAHQRVDTHAGARVDGAPAAARARQADQAAVCSPRWTKSAANRHSWQPNGVRSGRLYPIPGEYLS